MTGLQEPVPAALRVTATSRDDGEIMAVEHREHPVTGPEVVSPALQHRPDTFMARPPGRGGVLSPVHAFVDQVQIASADRSPVRVQQHLEHWYNTNTVSSGWRAPAHD